MSGTRRCSKALAKNAFILQHNDYIGRLYIIAGKAPVRQQKQTRMEVNHPLDVSQLGRVRRRNTRDYQGEY
ncbi:hypothetical protein M513_09257 [Trichuris suis]|uniref:Uncharacterized protein n=1 Tax=Trichuris suis TaxID=68888 RepID=A0A085LXU4_9BILA|nr:hypothetical protein M513_09257 [Trichuris suis]